jgi:hypothetical protein
MFHQQGRMLYELMLSGVGFLTACLLMAILAPMIHERAVRLTVRRLARKRPRSVIDRRAHEDQLRAQFAVSVRRLQTAIEDAQGKAASHLCELAKKSAEIARLKAELRRTNLVIWRFQARELMRRSATRSIVKLLVYLFVRWQRHGRRAPAAASFARRELKRALGTVSA